MVVNYTNLKKKVGGVNTRPGKEDRLITIMEPTPHKEKTDASQDGSVMSMHFEQNTTPPHPNKYKVRTDMILKYQPKDKSKRSCQSYIIQYVMVTDTSSVKTRMGI